MKVNGAVFKKARQEIRKDSPKRGKQGQPAKGTQEWLANVSLVSNDQKERRGEKWKTLSVRTIQALEKGEASIETVDAVSPHLGINGRELILGYGKEHVTCKGAGVIDFRPSVYPPKNPNSFADSPLMVTIDPLTLYFEEIDISSFHLESIDLELHFPGYKKKLFWLYEVSLTPSSSGWLGIVKEMHPFSIELTSNKFSISKSVMFSSDEINPPLWKDFVCAVENSNYSQINIDVKIKFSNFEKSIRLFLSIDFIKHLFSEGREKRKSKWPYRVQIKPLVNG